MERYKNSNGGSGILAYEIHSESIIVQFNPRVKYVYTYRSAGSHNIEKMKQLATNGSGLNSFINKNVKHKYERIIK